MLGGLIKSKPAPSTPFDRLVNAFPVADIAGFDRAVALARTRKNTGRIYFIGNGGSAAIASHMATDWLKNGQFAAQCFNDGAQLTCISNDLGYGSVFAEPLRRFGKKEDLLFAISSSGKSLSILNACDVAEKIGMPIITASGFEATNPLRTRGAVNFYVPSVHFGTVEIVHLAIVHAILDKLMGGISS